MIKLKSLLREQDTQLQLPDELVWQGKEDLQRKLIELGADQYPAHPQTGRHIEAYTFGVNNTDNAISLIDPTKKNQPIKKTGDTFAWFRKDGSFTLGVLRQHPETGEYDYHTHKGTSYKLLSDGRIHCKLNDSDFIDMILDMFGIEAKTTGNVYIGKLKTEDILYAQIA